MHQCPACGQDCECGADFGDELNDAPRRCLHECEPETEDDNIDWLDDEDWDDDYD